MLSPVLYRMQKAGIPCPQVVTLKKHILVMSFIGQDQVPAPKLKEVKLSNEDMKKAYYQVLNVRRMLSFLNLLATVNLRESKLNTVIVNVYLNFELGMV